MRHWLLLLLIGTPALAQPLTVGIKEAPPFVMSGNGPSEGLDIGISIDLWEELAQRLDLDYTFETRNLEGLLTGVEDGSLDVAISAITVNAEREAHLDFSHPYYRTGLGIMTRLEGQNSALVMLRRVFSLDTLLIIASLCVLLALAGLAVWLFERRANAEQFGSHALRGLGEGFWWSAVTMTTVGYGDKAPQTLGGRIVALIWMFASLIIFSSFVASLTSVVTLESLESSIQGPNDLYNVRVATLADSTSEDYLQSERIVHEVYPTIEEAIEAMLAGEADAVIQDAPLLQFLAADTFRGRVRLVPAEFEPQDYGVALSTGSPLREPINRELLDILSGPTWDAILARYLGEPER